MNEVNLLDAYPRLKRSINDRSSQLDNVRTAREFGEAYFDGRRAQGYGGYYYDGRWIPVADRFAEFYRLRRGDTVLDVGCAKGFLLHDLRVHHGITVVGLDISRYALQHALTGTRHRLVQGTADKLPFADKAFDLVICINTIHNLPLERCQHAIRELGRVAKHQYLQVDSWFTAEQEANFGAWRLTAETVFDLDGWRALLQDVGYGGEVWWTLCE